METFEEIGDSLKSLNKDAVFLSTKDNEDNLTDIIVKLREEETSLIASVAKLKSDAEEHEEVISHGLTKDIQSLRSERSNIGELVKNSNSELRAIHVEIASRNAEFKKINEDITANEILAFNQVIELSEKLKQHESMVESDYEELQEKAKEIDEKIHNHNLRANELDTRESEFNKKETEFNKEMDIKNIQVSAKDNALSSDMIALKSNRDSFEKDKNTTLSQFNDKRDELMEREKLVREEEVKIQEEIKSIEASKADIIKSINDLKTNWDVFKREKVELKLKLKQLGG